MPALPTSPRLMNRENTALLIVDVQDAFRESVIDFDRMVWNIDRLAQAATLFQIPVAATQQYSKGLGTTVATLAKYSEPELEKLTFSCRELGTLFEEWRRNGISSIVVTGIELHVCIQQTVMDLLAYGFEIYLPIDAVSGRLELDAKTAIDRMRDAGTIVTTCESAMFEWCESAIDPCFKQISDLAKQTYSLP
jgi:nicotinamidase-related amidase